MPALAPPAGRAPACGRAGDIGVGGEPIALVLIAVPTVALSSGPDNMGDPDAPQGLAGAVLTATYAPMLAWPLLLAALTVAYWLRRGRA